MRTRILIVDDDAALVELLTLFIASDEYEIVSAENVAEAITAIQKYQPAAIITDSLPGFAGLQVISAFRKSNPAGPAILFTGMISEDTTDQALRVGASVVLFKPVELNEVVSTLKRLLAKSA